MRDSARTPPSSSSNPDPQSPSSPTTTSAATRPPPSRNKFSNPSAIAKAQDPAIEYFQNTGSSICELPKSMNYSSEPLHHAFLESKPTTSVSLPNPSTMGHIQTLTSISPSKPTDLLPLTYSQVPLFPSHPYEVGLLPANAVQGVASMRPPLPPALDSEKMKQRLRRLQRTAILKVARERQKARPALAPAPKPVSLRRSRRNPSRQTRSVKREQTAAESGKNAANKNPQRRRYERRPRNDTAVAGENVPSKETAGDKERSDTSHASDQNCTHGRNIRNLSTDRRVSREKSQSRRRTNRQSKISAAADTSPSRKGNTTRGEVLVKAGSNVNTPPAIDKSACDFEGERMAELEKQVAQLQKELTAQSVPDKISKNRETDDMKAGNLMKWSPAESIGVANVTDGWSTTVAACLPWKIGDKNLISEQTHGTASIERLYAQILQSIQIGAAPPCESALHTMREGILSKLTVADKAAAFPIFSKMTQEFLRNAFSLFLKVPSNVDVSWDIAVVQNIVMPILRYTKSESVTFYKDVGNCCVKAVCDAALLLSIIEVSVTDAGPKQHPPSQRQVESIVRAMELSTAILITEDKHILAGIPEETVSIFGRRNILFSLRWAALESS